MEEYSQTQFKFYAWFREQYEKKFDSELTYCESIIHEWNSIVTDLRKRLDAMTFEERSRLPELRIVQPQDTGDQNGYSISIEKSD